MKFVSTVITALFLLAITALPSAAQSLSSTGQSRQVSAFHGISVSGGIDLYLSNGEVKVVVEAKSDDVIDHIVTEVQNGILRIHPEDNWRPSGKNLHMKVYVSTAQLDKLSASGGSDTYFQTEINSPHLTIDLSGGSDLKGSITSEELKLSQSGGSDAHLSGTVKKLTVDASGGSDLDGYDLITGTANINSSGGSDASLTIHDSLEVNASGGSDVHYKGNPAVSHVHASGSSSVVKKG